MMRELLLLIGLWGIQVCAFRRNGAEATAFQVDEVRLPEPTPPPTLLLQHENLKRAAATSSGLSNNLCGWVDGNEGTSVFSFPSLCFFRDVALTKDNRRSIHLQRSHSNLSLGSCPERRRLWSRLFDTLHNIVFRLCVCE
jgi:hypothetical protein